MEGTIVVELHDLRFTAAHGIYAEERKLKTEFRVDVFVQYSTKKEIIHKIAETIDYVSVYQTVKDEMETPKDLLEETAMRIVNRLKEQYALIEEVSISIKKLTPPITNFIGSVGVSYKKVFN